MSSQPFQLRQFFGVGDNFGGGRQIVDFEPGPNSQEVEN
jgi:hypothetical protein